MITDDSVERVREAADIVQIVGEHVDLKRTGADYRGPCPFHGGTHRNFSVSPKKNLYYCFVCHEHGDAFDFARKHLGMDFPSAVRHVAERSGVEIVETDTRSSAPDDREPLWEAIGAAMELFRTLLWDDPAGAPAREYLAGRGVTRDVAEPFGLGFAPRDGAVVRSRLHALGFDDRRLVEVGLLVVREEGGDPRPRFRDRLMFPIRDAAGHPVGFGGRLLGPGEPKYLNSPETRVFTKGRLLYHLHRAKQDIRRDARVLLVEGYFDVLRLSAAGIDSVVAPLGTALTEAQAALVARYTREAFLLYDSDEAGLKATFRSGLELLRHGVAVRVVTLPGGDDPDTFVARHGAERLERELGGAVDLFERQVQILERRGFFADLHRKRRAVDKLLPTIRAASDPLTRDLYVGRLSELAGIDRATVVHEVEALRRAPAIAQPTARDAAAAREEERARTDAPAGGSWRPTRRAAPRTRGRGERRGGDRREEMELIDTRRPRPYGERTRGSERYLVLAMLHLEGQIEAIAERVRPESFRDPIYTEICSTLIERGEVGAIDTLAEALSEDAAAALEPLLADRGALDPPRRVIEDSIAQLRYFDLEEQILDVRGAIERAEGERRSVLQAELQRLVAEKMSLGIRGDWKANKSNGGGRGA